MATIEELTRLDREIAVAEHRALKRLAEHLRDAAIDLPIQSRLALTFARHAQVFEARRTTVFSALSGLDWDVKDDVQHLEDRARLDRESDEEGGE